MDEHKMISGHYHDLLENDPHGYETSHGSSIDDKFHGWMQRSRNYHKVGIIRFFPIATHESAICYT